jgi:very-short-patch-repair endonuclease
MPHRVVPEAHRRFARANRRAMTEAEFRLWQHVRGRQLGGLAFRRQVPVGPFIVHFFCPDRRLVVEVDGGQHFDGAGLAADARRSEWLETAGYAVLRVPNREVVHHIDGVGDAILAAAAEHSSGGRVETSR